MNIQVPSWNFRFNFPGFFHLHMPLVVNYNLKSSAFKVQSVIQFTASPFRPSVKISCGPSTTHGKSPGLSEATSSARPSNFTQATDSHSFQLLEWRSFYFVCIKWFFDSFEPLVVADLLNCFNTWTLSRPKTFLRQVATSASHQSWEAKSRAECWWCIQVI